MCTNCQLICPFPLPPVPTPYNTNPLPSSNGATKSELIYKLDYQSTRGTCIRKKCMLLNLYVTANNTYNWTFAFSHSWKWESLERSHHPPPLLDVSVKNSLKKYNIAWNILHVSKFNLRKNSGRNKDCISTNSMIFLFIVNKTANINQYVHICAREGGQLQGAKGFCICKWHKHHLYCIRSCRSEFVRY